MKTTQEKNDDIQSDKLTIYEAMLSNENYMITAHAGKIEKIEFKDKIDDNLLSTPGVYLHWQ